MPDAHYINPRLAEIYDLDSPWSIDRDFYLALAGTSSKSILDLGCGTGLLCDAYAAIGHDVTGVDPAAAMLELGRRKPQGELVEWVHASAQNYKSHKLFDLVIMTGHAFQVLLEDEDILAVFSVVKKHMNSSGLFVFESRNPLIDWTKDWDYEMALSLPDCIVQESRRFISMQRDLMSFELRYRFPDAEFISESRLRFLSFEAIQERLSACGLRVDQILGDWHGNSFDKASSREMIFKVKALT